MVKPPPTLKRCAKCGKIFLYAPKSDCLNPLDFLCKKCRGEKRGLMDSVIAFLRGGKK